MCQRAQPFILEPRPDACDCVGCVCMNGLGWMGLALVCLRVCECLMSVFDSMIVFSSLFFSSPLFPLYF